MGVNVESDIGKALDAFLLATPSIWPVSWENVETSPPADGKYLRTSFQPNETETRFLDAGNYYRRGIYQVTVVTKQGVGKYVATAQASLIARRFAYLTEIVTASGTLRVEKEPSVGGGLKSGSNFEVPVTIRYAMWAD